MSSGGDREMPWWGWGGEGETTLSDSAGALLEEALGLEGRRARRASLEEVRLPDPALPAARRRELAAVVGDDMVRSDRLARVAHAVGRSYPDLVRIRSGDGSSAPDAVVYPASHDEVSAVLSACAASGIAVVPFGGGTSVVGGVEPVRDGFKAAISLDLARLRGLSALDRRSLTATFGAGTRGPEVEARLGQSELTLGHFPQSFEFATVGGWVATRSAGQGSTGYGRIEDLVVGLRLAAPAGDLETGGWPASAAGPALGELLLGSEGVLGVVTEATLSVRPAPRERRYEGWSFRSFEAGAEALRELEQAHAAPDVARLSDEEETRLSLALTSRGSSLERAGRAYLRLRGREQGCLAILGWEGEGRDLARRRAAAAPLLRRGGGVPLGGRPGAAWLRGRYRAPYLRDELLDRGVMVETLETATSWSRLLDLHRSVAAALRSSLERRGSPALVMCHISHLYPSGASLYYTFLARQEAGAELEQWRAAKGAAADAIEAAGATITHHHAVGRDHAPWMGAEVGELGLGVLRAAKERLDPGGIMNPGKLLPSC